METYGRSRHRCKALDKRNVTYFRKMSDAWGRLSDARVVGLSRSWTACHNFGKLVTELKRITREWQHVDSKPTRAGLPRESKDKLNG